MKKFVKFSIAFLALALLFIVPSMAFAQDSAVVSTVSDPTANLFAWLVAFIPAKYQATVLVAISGLFLLEQVLAASEKIKANSTFQLVGGWIVALYKAVTSKSK